MYARKDFRVWFHMCANDLINLCSDQNYQTIYIHRTDDFEVAFSCWVDTFSNPGEILKSFSVNPAHGLRLLSNL